MKFADLVAGKDYSYERHGTFRRVTVLDTARMKERRYSYGDQKPWTQDPQGRSVLCLIRNSQFGSDIPDQEDIVPVNKIVCTWAEQLLRDERSKIVQAEHRERKLRREQTRSEIVESLNRRFARVGLAPEVYFARDYSEEPTVKFDGVASINALLAKLEG